MHRSNLLKNGIGQSILIPEDLAATETDIPAEADNADDEIRIPSSRRRLTGLLDVFAAFPADFLVDGRGSQEQADREAI
ncbi:MAG: AbrB family transcriptional regulator [Cupriavidus sp.]|nr:AbrB family transcriptional regulator [Cupriavidus sp.]